MQKSVVCCLGQGSNLGSHEENNSQTLQDVLKDAVNASNGFNIVFTNLPGVSVLSVKNVSNHDAARVPTLGVVQLVLSNIPPNVFIFQILTERQ